MTSKHFLQRYLFLALGAVALTMEIWYWQSPWLGVPALGCFLLGIIRLQPDAGSRLRAVMAAGSLWLGFCLFAVYFFSFQPIVIWLGLVAVVIQQVRLQSSSAVFSQTAKPERAHTSWFKTVGRALPVLLVVVIGLLSAWQVGQLSEGQHLYQGGVAPGWPVIASAILVGAVVVLAVVVRTRSWLLTAVALWIALNSFYVTRLDTLYGADSWRHFGKIVRVESGQPYAPTELSEIVKLSNEKVPNASLYTFIPLLHRLTGIEMLTLYRYGAIALFGPLLMLITYVATKELTNRRRAAQLVVLAGFLAPGFFSLEGYLNVRTIGIVALATTVWVWLRYCLAHQRASWWELLPITAMSTLAYPTTGYISLLVALLALTLRNFGGWRRRWPSLLLTLGLGLSFSIIIPFLDISRMGVTVQPLYHQEWWRVFDIVRNWLTGAINFDDIIRSSFALVYFSGLVWLWWRHHDRVFVLVGSLSLAVMIDVWLLSTFTASYAPFSSRMPMILSMGMAVLFGLGLDRLFLLVPGRAQRRHHVALGLLVTALIVQQNNLGLLTIGWTPSQREVQAAQTIIDQNQDYSYRVLTDETTSAVGYALAEGNEVSWSWYPNNELSAASDRFISSPSRTVLQTTCTLSGSVNRVYFLKAPIPPSNSLSAKEAASIRTFMTLERSTDGVEVYRYDCPTT